MKKLKNVELTLTTLSFVLLSAVVGLVVYFSSFPYFVNFLVSCHFFMIIFVVSQSQPVTQPGVQGGH